MTEFIGKFFARLLPLLLVLVIMVVVSRYVFGVGRTDIQELALYLHGLIFLGCAGWAYIADEHVRVDIFYRNASPAYKKLINTLGIILFLAPVMGIIGFYSIDFVTTSWAIQEISTEPGGLTIVFIQKTFIFLFPIVLIIAGIREFRQLWK